MLKKSKKGQLTINGILGIVISIIFLALTMPIQVTFIDMALNSTADATNRLLLLSIIPFELLMMLSAVVYAGRSVRASVEDFRY